MTNKRAYHYCIYQFYNFNKFKRENKLGMRRSGLWLTKITRCDFHSHFLGKLFSSQKFSFDLGILIYPESDVYSWQQSFLFSQLSS